MYQYSATLDYFYFCSVYDPDNNNAYFNRIKASSPSKFLQTKSYYLSSSGEGIYTYGCYVDGSSSVDLLYTYISYTTVG